MVARALGLCRVRARAKVSCIQEDDKYLGNIDPGNNFKMNETRNYLKDSDKIVVKSLKNLAMMTFNIRRIRNSFKSFTDLLSSKH